ncbi:MAG: hypothetical protein ACI9DK_001204 [Vicingaceae bacterium]|jgi:hypothetical protein
MRISNWRYVTIFSLYFIVRFIFVWFNDFNFYEKSADTDFIIELSNRVVQGNFNFDIGRFLVAPFYNIYVALFIYMANSHWEIYLLLSQLGISSLTGRYIYKIAEHLLTKRPQFYQQ